MTILNINSKLAWKSDFDISQAVIPFEYESIKELKNANFEFIFRIVI